MQRRMVLRVARAAAVVAVALLLFNFVGTTVRITGDSMLPTLHDGERAWVARSDAWWPLGGRALARGDIVFFASPQRSNAPESLFGRLLGGRLLGAPYSGAPLLVKRIVALGGEEIEIEGGSVRIDGGLLDEPYSSGPSSRSMSATPVPAGALFVLGDHRAPLASRDSRSFGPIEASSVAGRLSAVLWPPLRRDEDGNWRFNLRRL